MTEAEARKKWLNDQVGRAYKHVADATIGAIKKNTPAPMEMVPNPTDTEINDMLDEQIAATAGCIMAIRYAEQWAMTLAHALRLTPEMVQEIHAEADRRFVRDRLERLAQVGSAP